MTTWYREGLVSLTAGSDLVAGVGTEWVDNVLPGGIFFTPTGLVEVERVISDSSLKLVTPYAGPGAAGVEYAVAPTQGYVTALSKEVNALLGDFGDLKDAWQEGSLNGKGLALKGVKDTVADLPSTGNLTGDGWVVDSTLFVWTGTAWHETGSMVTTPELEALRDTALTAAASAAETREAYEDRVYPGVYSTPPTQKPHSGALPQPGDRCVILIGIVGYEHVRMGGAWLVPNIDAAQLALETGSQLVGHAAAGTINRPRTMRSKVSGWIDLFDEIPEVEHQAIFNGTSLYDAFADCQRASAKALSTGKGLKAARGKRLNLSDHWDVRGIQRIEIAVDIRMAVEKTITVGGGALGGAFKIRFSDVTNGTSVLTVAPPTVPVFRVFGLKRSEVTVGSCNYTQVYADAAVASGGSTAYNDVYLTGTTSLVEIRGAAGESWCNENRIWGGGIQRYHVIGGGYKHNHNKLFAPTFEGANVSIRFENASTNQIYGARFEDVAGSLGIYFGADTYGNSVLQTWSGVGNPRAQFSLSIPVVDLGAGNMVSTESAALFKKTTVLSVSARSTVVGNATDSVADFDTVGSNGYEPFPNKTVLTPSLAGVEVGSNRVIAMSEPLPLRLGDTFAFAAEYEGALCRPYFFIFDANMQPITSEGAGGAFIASPGLGTLSAQGYYSLGANQAKEYFNAQAAVVTRADVAFVRYAFTTAVGGVFRHLTCAVYSQPLGRGLLESAAALRPMRKVLAGAPTKGAPPVGYHLYDSVGKRDCWVTYRLDTTLTTALAAGGTATTLASTGTAINGDIVGVLLDDGTTHWTTAAGLSGTPFEVTIGAIPEGRSAAVGARVAVVRWAFSALLYSGTYAAGTIANGAAATTTVTIPGAAFGDRVTVTYGRDLLGVALGGAVSAADNVAVRFQNGTGSSAALSSSVLRVRVEKA